MATIALCMIARDEERFIQDCLRSVGTGVDQMIVVDTGSVDRTVALAEAEGAEVVHFPWCDDFSAARNAALPHVDADWILVLDADEQLAEGASHRLRELVSTAAFDVGLLALHHASELTAAPADVLSGAKRMDSPVLLPRLIRRDPAMKWKGVVHETLADWVTANQRVVRTVDLNIVHYGNVPELRTARDKAARNLALCEQRCADTPHDVVARTYLSRELIRAGQIERARTEIEQAWGTLTEQMSQPGPRPTPVSTAMVRAHLALQAGETDVVLDTIERTRSYGVDHPNLDLLEGVAWEARAFADDPEPEALRYAKAAFLAATEHHGRVFDEEVLPGATSWASATRLGIVLLADAQPDLALQVLEAAIEKNGIHRDALLGRAEALLDLDRPREALRALEPLLQPQDPNGWLLATEACIAMGAADGAQTFFKRMIRAEQAGQTVDAHRRHRRARLTAAAEVD